MSGTRSLTLKAAKKIQPHLKLKKQEESFFVLLVNLEESPKLEDRKKALKKIQRYKAYKDFNQKEFEVFKYMTKWYYVVIREMAAMENFRMDAKWIQKNLIHHVPLSEIERTLTFLKKYNFVMAEENGSASLPEKVVDCSQGVYQIALADYQKKMLSLASKSIDKTKKDDRSITSYTFAIPSNNLEKVKEILNQSLKNIIALEDTSKESDSVYHICFNAFPLAKSDEKESE